MFVMVVGEREDPLKGRLDESDVPVVEGMVEKPTLLTRLDHGPRVVGMVDRIALRFSKACIIVLLS